METIIPHIQFRRNGFGFDMLGKIPRNTPFKMMYLLSRGCSVPPQTVCDGFLLSDGSL